MVSVSTCMPMVKDLTDSPECSISCRVSGDQLMGSSCSEALLWVGVCDGKRWGLRRRGDRSVAPESPREDLHTLSGSGSLPAPRSSAPPAAAAPRQHACFRSPAHSHSTPSKGTTVNLTHFNCDVCFLNFSCFGVASRLQIVFPDCFLCLLCFFKNIIIIMFLDRMRCS